MKRELERWPHRQTADDTAGAPPASSEDILLSMCLLISESYVRYLFLPTLRYKATNQEVNILLFLVANFPLLFR